MFRTPEDTALCLSVMLQRSGKTRARISRKTVKLISNKKSLRLSWLDRLFDQMEDYGWLMTHIDCGGFGAVAIRTLTAAKTVSPSQTNITLPINDDSFQLLKNELVVYNEFEDDEEE